MCCYQLQFHQTGGLRRWAGPLLGTHSYDQFPWTGDKSRTWVLHCALVSTILLCSPVPHWSPRMLSDGNFCFAGGGYEK